MRYQIFGVLGELTTVVRGKAMDIDSMVDRLYEELDDVMEAREHCQDYIPEEEGLFDEDS